MAIVETIVAVPLYWWIAIHFQTYALLISSAMVAPFVLLRSDESVACGVKWFTTWENQDRSGRASALKLAISLLIASISCAATHLFTTLFIVGSSPFAWWLYLTGWSIALVTGGMALAVRWSTSWDWILVQAGALLGILIAIGFNAMMVGAILGSMLLAITAFFRKPFSQLRAAIHSFVETLDNSLNQIEVRLIGKSLFPKASYYLDAFPKEGKTASILLITFMLIGPGTLTLPFIIGIALGVVLVSLVVRIGATVTYIQPGLRSLAQNFWRLTFCISPRQEPELIPGLPVGQTRFTWQDHMLTFKNDRSSNELLSVVMSYVLYPTTALLWFLPGWLYRVTLKSTDWLWWPLAFLIQPPKLAKNPQWLHAQVIETNWARHMRVIAFTSIAAFLGVGIWRTFNEGRLPENPFLNVLGYGLSIDWSTMPWQLLGVLGSLLSLAIAYLVDWTFQKFNVATQTNDIVLRGEALRHFDWIERLCRLRTLFFVFYCALVGFHAVLMLNARACWFVPASSIEAWSDALYRQYAPKDRCSLTVN